MKKFLVLFSLFLVSLVLMFIPYNTDTYKFQNNGLLYINEIMASNKYTIKDKDGDYSDYIELYNGYDYDIDLSGYYLSDKNNFNTKWAFPSITIKAHSYLLVFASSKNVCENDECHTNFKLSSSGGVVCLADKSNKILSKIRYEQTGSDTSYGYNGDMYVYYYVGTPLQDNGNDYSEDVIEREDSSVTLRINEYTNNNISLMKAFNGKYYSMVELYNYGEEDIDLDGYYLSDSESNLIKYRFSDVVIKGGEYLVIYLSGLDTIEKGQIHTGFELTSNDKVLVLSDNRLNRIDKIKVEELLPNMVVSYVNDSYLYSYNATFGKENSSLGTEKLTKDTSNVKSIIINEVTSSMLELKNMTDKDINLHGYKIKGNGSYMMTFPDVTIKKDGYLVLYESDNYSYQNGKIYTGFKISNSKEAFTLYDANNNVIDTFTSGKIRGNQSYGIDDNGARVIYVTNTIGKANSGTSYTGYSSTVDFSIDGGYVFSGTSISLSTKDSSDIYYTLDGSTPSKNSKHYTEPITITKTTVVKAISYKDGSLNSDVVSRTYFVGRKHDMAVVSVSTNSNDLWGSNGLFTKYKNEIEVGISFEFYENDGTFGLMFNGGTKLVGQDSREFPQKSMAIYLRDKYGQDEMTYPLFEDHDVVHFSSFTLRNSGEDVTYLKFKDAFLVEVLKGQMDLDFQYYRPVVVYINGVYYGIYNIREKINEAYLEDNQGVDKDNVDLIKGDWDVRAGSYTSYGNLLNYVTTHNLANQANYEYVKTQIDIQELINYWVVQTYYANTDTGNIRYYREKPDGKWRWVLFDQDWSLWPTLIYQPMLIYPFQPYGHGFGFSTALTYNLWKNAEFRDQYLKTFAYHLKNTFNPDRMLKIFDEVKAKYEKEMPYHCDRWYNDFASEKGYALTMNSWYNHIEQQKQTIKARYQVVLNNLRSQFGLSNAEYQKYFGGL